MRKTTSKELIADLDQKGYLCLMPRSWNRLYKILLKYKHADDKQLQRPLILSAWWYSCNEDKAERLREHLRWAEQHNALPEVRRFISSISADQWLCDQSKQLLPNATLNRSD